MTREPRAIVLFDGDCNLCNGAVAFVIARDRRRIFHFASLQSPAGARLLSAHDLPHVRVDPAPRLSNGDPDHWQSIVLVERGRVHRSSTASLRILRRLGLPWAVLSLFLIVPPAVRDAVYAYVARNRYRWFGKHDSCVIPTPDVRDRFLG